MRIEEACPNVGDVARRQDELATRTKIDRFIIFDCRALSWRSSPAAGFGSVEDNNDWQPLVVKPETPSPWGEPVEWEEIEANEWYLVHDCCLGEYRFYRKSEGELAWVGERSLIYRFTPPEPPEPVKPPEWLGAVKTPWEMVGFVTRIIDAKRLYVLWQDGSCGQSEIAFDSMTPAPEHHPLKPELAKLFEGGE